MYLPCLLLVQLSLETWKRLIVESIRHTLVDMLLEQIDRSAFFFFMFKFSRHVISLLFCYFSLSCFFASINRLSLDVLGGKCTNNSCCGSIAVWNGLLEKAIVSVLLSIDYVKYECFRWQKWEEGRKVEPGY